ncbi:hypothetical protein [Povalibacter sp.]|uniref:hypothetical protein n=1 Tax=Povalibacter sp. TaxID=1962978 RepID=UPI002F40683D
MANPQNPNPPTFSPARSKPETFIPNPIPNSQEKQEQRQDADQVEIGDPVPEKDRTTRASDPTVRGGQGETGEDEDLPDDDGGIEGSSGEQH